MNFEPNWQWLTGLGLSTVLATLCGGEILAQAQPEPDVYAPTEGQPALPTTPTESLPISAPEAEAEQPFNPGGISPQTDIFGISSAYRLGIGDVITINVFGAEDYSTEVIVLQDGTINLPRVGPVFVLGQTFQETERTVATRYGRYIRQPIITIFPVTLRPVRIAIAGAVKRPGSYTFDQGFDTENNGRTNNFPSLTAAISLAGGITGKANIREVQVRRYVAHDETEVRTFNLWDLIQSGDLRQDVVLQSGDEVIIPEAVDVTPAQTSELARASFAPEFIQVYIAGEVENPGPLEVPLDTALNQAILNAGGFNPRANRTVVDLVRVNPDGTVNQRQIEVNFGQDINEAVNPILMDQDIIVVNRSGLSRFGDSVGIVLSPVTQILNTILGLDRLLFD